MQVYEGEGWRSLSVQEQIEAAQHLASLYPGFVYRVFDPNANSYVYIPFAGGKDENEDE